MALNANSVLSTRKSIPPMEPGTYPARLCQVIELGLQPDTFKGEEKAPKIRMMLTYEMSDAFLQDENGQDMEDKPRWLSEQMWLFSLKADKAVSTARYNVFDPQGVKGGDFVACLEAPVNVTVVQDPGKGKNAGKIFNKVGGVSAMRQKDAEKCPPLVNAPRAFTWDDPDIEMFMGFPDYIKNIIRNALNFKGSDLEKALAGVKTEAKPEKQEAAKPGQPVKAATLAEELDESPDNPY